MLRNALVLTTMLMCAGSALARTIPFPNFERTLKVTDRLMKIHGVSGEQYSILRYSIACNLANFLQPKDLYMAEFQTDEQLAAKMSEPNFWAEKLHRDLNVPYTNEDVEKRLDKMQTEVAFFLKYLASMNYRQSPVQLYVYGSIAKGRFGGNSDIDIYIDSSDKDLLRRLENGVYREGHPMFLGPLEILTSNFEPANILDPLLPVSFRELRDIKGLYGGVLKELGFEMKGKGRNFEIVRTPIPPRMAIEFNPIEDRVFYLTMKSNEWLHSLADQFTSLRPDSGSAAQRTAERLKAEGKRLVKNWQEVEADLSLIEEDKPSSRLWKIREVIDPQSWVKMKAEGLVEYMSMNCRNQRERLESTLATAFGDK